MDIGERAVENMISWWSTVAVARGGIVNRSSYLAEIDGLGTNPIVNRAIVTERTADSGDVDADVICSFDARDAGVFGVLDPFASVQLETCGWDRAGSVPLPEMAFMPSGAAPTTKVDIRDVTDEPGLAQFNDVVRNGFDFVPWGDDAVLPSALLRSASRLFVAYEGATPVATALAHNHAGVTGVYLVATLPEARGRGLGAAVSWAATYAFGDQPATLQASAQGEPIYTRMGYETTRQMRLWIRERRYVRDVK